MCKSAPYHISLYWNTERARIWNSIHYTYTYTYTYFNIYFSITNSSTRSSISQPQHFSFRQCRIPSVYSRQSKSLLSWLRRPTGNEYPRVSSSILRRNGNRWISKFQSRKGHGALCVRSSVALRQCRLGWVPNLTYASSQMLRGFHVTTYVASKMTTNFRRCVRFPPVKNFFLLYSLLQSRSHLAHTQPLSKRYYSSLR